MWAAPTALDAKPIGDGILSHHLCKIRVDVGKIHAALRSGCPPAMAQNPLT